MGRSPVYAYHFEQTSPYNPVATHSKDVQYVFGNLPAKVAVSASAQDLALSGTLQSYWTNVARAADPNGSGLPQWPRYAGAGTQTMRPGAVIRAGAKEGAARLQFLDRFRANGLLDVTQHERGVSALYV